MGAFNVADPGQEPKYHSGDGKPIYEIIHAAENDDFSQIHARRAEYVRLASRQTHSDLDDYFTQLSYENHADQQQKPANPKFFELDLDPSLVDDFDQNFEEFPDDDCLADEFKEFNSFNFDRGKADTADYYEDNLIDENAISVKLNDELPDSVRRASTLAFIPTPYSWQVPAFFGFGNVNGVLPQAEVLTYLRYWEEKYGAVITYFTPMVMTVRPYSRPTTMKDALELVAEIARFDSDYFQFESPTQFAAHLLQQTWWQFWWD